VTGPFTSRRPELNTAVARRGMSTTVGWGKRGSSRLGLSQQGRKENVELNALIGSCLAESL